jgi:hypothetical protein
MAKVALGTGILVAGVDSAFSKMHGERLANFRIRLYTVTLYWQPTAHCVRFFITGL